MTTTTDPRALLARLMEENPTLDRAELRRLFFDAVDPELERERGRYLRRIIDDVFNDLYTQLRKPEP